MTLIAPTLQAFFSDRLVKQLHASPRTITSYRDTLSLLLRFVQDTTGTAPSALDWDELDEPVIAAFLEHLRTERHNSAHGTSGSPRSDPCSPTPPSITPSTPA
jgi:site-specific recombinase XerC